MIFGINAYVFTGFVVVGVIVTGVGLLKSRRRRYYGDKYDQAGEYMVGYAETLAWDLQYMNQERREGN